MGLPIGRAEARSRVAQVLRSASYITAVCHENPDADTLGAALAVRLMAEHLGVDAEVVSADPPPAALGFLSRVHEVRDEPHLPPGVAVICDAASLSRIGRIRVEHADWLARSQVVNVDHHATNERFGDVNLVVPAAGATCEVMTEVADELGIPMDGELATVLLAGIVRDTRGFADPSTSPATLRLSARLMEGGADLAETHRQVLSGLTPPAMQLWGRVLTGLRFELDGRVVGGMVTGRMLEDARASLDEAEGIAEFMACAKGVEVAILARELAPGRTRMSVRTHPTLDASELVRAFAGGGHGSRAGCVVDLEPSAALAALLAECRRLIPPLPEPSHSA